MEFDFSKIWSHCIRSSFFSDCFLLWCHIPANREKGRLWQGYADSSNDVSCAGVVRPRYIRIYIRHLYILDMPPICIMPSLALRGVVQTHIPSPPKYNSPYVHSTYTPPQYFFSLGNVCHVEKSQNIHGKKNLGQENSFIPQKTAKTFFKKYTCQLWKP